MQWGHDVHNSKGHSEAKLGEIEMFLVFLF